jgi:ABC-type antimicrobial peptide transport system permease subunit
MSTSFHPAASPIENQVRLPFHVAWEIVVQGIRIRMGRSVVTLFGVVLGVAFLMSILSAGLIKGAVAGEIELRQRVAAMIGFLLADTGPLPGKTLALHRDSLPDAAEDRFVGALRKQGVSEIVSAAEMPALPGKKGLGALVVIGGSLPPDIWEKISPSLSHRLVAFTRTPSSPPAGASVVQLQREPSVEDLQKQAAARKSDRVRTIWIVTIAILVTMISISNALLMSVTERFREIGTMKCLGALSSFIRRIFFIESALIGFTGSVIGSAFGLIFSLAVYSATFGPGLVFSSISVLWLTVAYLVCTVGGILAAVIAAIYPADFASRMVPATALRTNI